MKRLFERYWDTRHGVGKIRPRTGPIRNPCDSWTRRHCFGLLLNPKALWVGGHYSAHNKRLCVNIFPCLTIWWAQPGGNLP